MTDGADRAFQLVSDFRVSAEHATESIDAQRILLSDMHTRWT